MDRNDLIKALGNAFLDPDKDDSSKSKVVSAVAGESDVLRLVTNHANQSERRLHENHPDAHMVTNLVSELSLSRRSDIEIVGRELMVKFNQAIENNDEPRIAEIVAVCKDLFYKLHNVSPSSPEKALIYMMVIDKIKAL